METNSQRRRWVRLNFWLALAAAVVYGVGLLILLQQDPDRFPTRWSKYGYGSDHGYLVVRSILLIASAILQVYLQLRRDELAGRVVAGMTGGFVLLYMVLVDSALSTIEVESPGDTGFLFYLSLSYLAFAFFGGATRGVEPVSFTYRVPSPGPMAAGRRQPGPPSAMRSLSHSAVESLVARGHAEQAIALYEAEARNREDDPTPFRQIARIERLELKRPERAIRALVEARKRVDGDGEAEAHITRQIAEIYLHDLKRPRPAMPELARLSAKFPGTGHGEWARRELRGLKVRLAAGELDGQATPMSVIPADVLRELDVLMRTRYGLVAIETDELDRVHPLLRHLSERRLLPLLTWSPTRGLHRDGQEAGGVYGTESPEGVLAHIAAADAHALYYLPSFAQYLEGNPTLTHLLTEVAGHFAEAEGAVVIAGPELNLPDTVRGAAALVRLPAPEPSQYRALLHRVIEGLERRMKVVVELDRAQQDALLMNLRGLTLSEAERLLTRMIVENGRLDTSDLEAVVEAKRQVVEKEGLLEYYSLEASMDEIAGLEGLKDWLKQRRGILAEPERAKEFGLDFPRGILLVGVPGSGKSLCAKAVAADWHLPLLKLDPGSLYNKYMGESERNFRRALRTSERMAPTVLWIDEIEKAFASGDADGGVSQRVFGSFLSWMQERRGDVFIVATANDISRLPAEFLRKGRFDEIFFVDLPDDAARAAIFDVHIRKRGQPIRLIDTQRLAQATEGFSGAEIEQVVVAGLFTAFSSGQPLTTESLLEEAALTRPLSVTMAERVAALREWARGRTRMA